MTRNKKIAIGIILAIFILILGFLFQGPLRCFSQPFIERIINETPQAKVTGYLEAVMENNKEEALRVWQLPDWKEDSLLTDRHENITEDLIAMGIKDFKILDIEWWRTCCEPGVIDNPESAGGARVQVQIESQNNISYIYIFDVFHREGSYWGTAQGCQLRHWVIRDIYLSDQQPLFWTLSPEEKASEAVPPEVVWNQYTNSSLGFSIKTPSEVYGLYKCPSEATIWAPVKVFEDNENRTVYISQEYYYRAEWDSELGEYTGPCEKITYSLASLRSGAEESYSGKPLLGWAVFVKDAKNEGELDEFIKEQYGPGCSAGDKQPREQQNGVYEVSVSADGTSLGDTTCPIGWMNRIKVLYVPEKNKLMSVILGQECTFLEPHQEPHQCYDEEMINSFRFKEEGITLNWEEQINAPSTLSSGEILGTVNYCTTACEDNSRYCSLESTEERNLKIQLRNLYNNNTINCYLFSWVDSESSIMMGMGEPPWLLLSKEVFDELRGDIIHSVGIKYLE